MRFTWPLVVLALAPTAFAQEWAKDRLEKSPRHGEWVTLKNGSRDVKAFLVFPEVKDKATAVVVIHEIFGLTDWVRGVADQLAEAGYIAITPDMLSGLGPNGGGTAELPGEEVRKKIATLAPDQITGDLNAAVKYVKDLPACNGKVVVAGFCWGGSQCFRFATNNKEIMAAYPFYGSAPSPEDLKRIACPVHGFYAENDARINAGLPKTIDAMKELGKTFEPVTYEGAGHGFMRAGEAPNATEANKKACAAAWKRWKELLKKA